MFSRTAPRQASLRYRRPYWMLHLQGADNWQIYTKMSEPEHQRTEMTYQAWLGGLDRPYVRPRCMATQPLWLEKKRHALKKPDLQGPETAIERYVLDWERKFFSFRGTLRPTAEDLHSAFDLVDTPLDLSYACTILGWCRNVNDIHFAEDTFTIFLEACLRVDRKDVAQHALQDAEKLGFWHVDPDVRAFLEDKQSWYAVDAAGNKLPSADAPAAAPASAEDADEAAMLAELQALEEEEARLAEADKK